MLFPSATPVQLSDTFPVYDHFLALCVLHDEIRLASTVELFVVHREFRAVGAESHVEELLVDGLRLEELRGVGGLNHKVVDQALPGRDKKCPLHNPPSPASKGRVSRGSTELERAFYLSRPGHSESA